MKIFKAPLVFKKHKQLCLMSLLSGLYTIYLSLVWRYENISHLGISILFGLAIFFLLQEQHHNFTLKSSIIATLIGIFLIISVLFYSVLQPAGLLLRVLPFASGLGIGLLASGFRGLKQYTRELIALFFLGVPSVIASLWLDISSATATFSRLLLLYIGFNVSGENVHVHLPTGSIKVVYDCSGIDQINYLISLSVLCLIMFPLKGWTKQIFVPLIGIILGFLTNVVRVSLMAIFAASNREVFKLWHTGEGSYIFAVTSVLLLSLFYRWLLKREEAALSKNSPL